jgi:succinoglycan biosynthesis protein ExoA
VISEPPIVTIIIPTRPGQAEIPAVAAARALDYRADRLEILVARGRQPAVQRNVALRAARGDLVYFLDDDTLPDAGNIRRALTAFQDPAVTILGGPNLCPATAPPLEQVFAVVLGSWAMSSSRARYSAVGSRRPTSEKELILCNMMARRKEILAHGGFDEALYPNEENALMDAVQKSGQTLLYDPEFIAYRRPRPTLRAFFKMMFTYGRGRAEQFRLHPTPGSALNFAPPLFCVYAVSCVIGALLLRAGYLPPVVAWAGAPMALYLLLAVVQALRGVSQHGLVRSALALPLQVVSHFVYGLGFWRGLTTRLKSSDGKAPTEVQLDSSH